MKNQNRKQYSFLNLQVIPFLGGDYMVIDKNLKKIIYSTEGITYAKTLAFDKLMEQFIAWDFISYLTTGCKKPDSLINFGSVYASAKKLRN